MGSFGFAAGLATGAAIFAAVSLWSLHVRDHHPEDYDGAIRGWGSLVRTRGFVIGFSFTLIALAVGSVVLQEMS